MLILYRTALAVWLLVLSHAATAKDFVLLISNENVSRHGALEKSYTNQEYIVVGGQNLDSNAMRSIISDFFSQVDSGDRVVLHFTGRSAHLGAQNWILPINTAADAALTLDYDAPSLGVILEMLVQRNAQPVVFLAHVSGEVTAPLTSGVDVSYMPQGILFVDGAHDKLNGFVLNDMLGGVDEIAQALAEKGDALRISGYGRQDILATREVERAALAENSQAVEVAMNLDRGERRNIQANLTVLGYNTGGVDGVFGDGSRGAILEWQKHLNGLATGFLDAAQIAGLQTRADARRVEMKAEDTQYWEQTGAHGDRNSIQAYLGEYPAGAYATRAKAELNLLERAERRVADEGAWETATRLNSADGYRVYLGRFSNGSFASTARTRLQTLEPAVATTNDLTRMTAKAQEDRLLLTSSTRLLIEGRLHALGHIPGNVDGVFTSSTRDAIYQYQKSKSITATGYISQATVQALLLG